MESFWQDLRYGIRMMAKNPGFTLVAVLALALGIGANTAIFSVIDAVILRPLPFAAPGRLVTLWGTNMQRGNSRGSASYPDFMDWRAQSRSFEGMAAWHESDFTLTGSGDPAHLYGVVVSPSLFHLLGVSPQIGRDFLPEEEDPGKAKLHPVILSHALWQNRFSSDPNVVGKNITLDNLPFTIVGVMPAGFQYPIQAKNVDLWMAVVMDGISADGGPTYMTQRGAHYLNVTGRLKPGVSVPQAQAEMETIASALSRQYADTNKFHGVKIATELDRMVGDVRPALLILFGAVGCVLLIACVNVANLLLARAASRQKEIAIRSSLGAGRMRIVRQLLTESLVLAFLGGALGLILAWWGTDVLLALSPANVPRVSAIHLSGRVLGFTALASLATGLFFGLLPALQISRSDLAETLKEGGRGSTEGAMRNRMRSALVVAEVALALVPLAGAGLLIQSFLRLSRVKPGFDPHNVLTVTIGLPDARYNVSQQAAFFEQLLNRTRALPGVRSAAAVEPLPLSSDQIQVSFTIEGRPVAKSDEPSTNYRDVTDDYFQTLHIPLLQGRDFSAQDNSKSPAVIIVNQTFSRTFFPGENPLGKHIQPGMSVGPGTKVMREIVGVVGDVRHLGLNQEAGPEVYAPESQMPFDGMILVVRTDSDPRSAIGAIRQQVRALDKDLPVFDAKLLEEYLSASLAQPRFNTFLLGIFAVVALLLAVVGLYGVMSYSVVQRTHEIGIRMALGAQAKNVMQMVVGQALRLTLTGCVIGLAGAWAVTRLMSTLLYGVSASDPATFAAVALLLGVVSLLACYVPARRAMRVDPMVALRYE
ncbi:MAG: ABC transporter permease [Candidatus Acidiferrales bacterium]